MLAMLLVAMVNPAFAQGPVTIGGVTYDHVDPGPPFTQAPRAPQDWSAPKPYADETAAGMMAYVTSDAGDYKPDRIPKPSEHVAKLSTFLAQGQIEATWVGVYGLADLQGLTATVDLKGAPLSVDIRHVHFWPQRTGWRSRQWYMTGEMLLPCANGMETVPATRGILVRKTFDLKRGETAAFWFTFTAGADARPGTYHCSVSITAGDRPALVLPLQVEILPFRLVKPPNKSWMLYADVFRWTNMSDDQILGDLRDFARHGITGLVEVPLGTPDLSHLKEGKVTFDASRFQRLVGLCDEAGIRGPFVCNLGGMAERVRDALGIQCDLHKGKWPQAIKDGVSAIARAAVAATKNIPARWYYYGVDEPNGQNTYAIQDYQAWHDGGAHTYATFGDPKFLAQAASYLTAPCFGVGLISNEAGAKAAREGSAKTGAEFWWYGIGSYVNPFPQECSTFYNRYGAGYLFWKTGARSAVAWTFGRAHGDVFNDFDGAKADPPEPKDQMIAYPHFLKPGDWSTYQGAIPTFAWEGLREGVDDYRYLATLSSAIAKARDSKLRAARDAARHAQETLDALTAAIPWTNPMVKSSFQTRRLQQVRRAVADQIVLVQAALEGKAVAPSARPEAHVSIRVSAVVPKEAGASSMPAIAAAKASAPPKIDGVLDDACWAKAPVAGNFRTMGDDKPAPVATEARLASDDHALYVAFRCAEPEMSKITARQTGHDAEGVWLDDSVEFFLASADRKKYAHLIVNTNGSVYDELGQDPSWNPAVEAKVHKSADSWSVEIALPWADLAKVGIARSPLMAVNFCRNRVVGGPETHSEWAFTGSGFHVPKLFGIAQFGGGAVALAGVHVPRSWGKQEVVAELRNLSDEAVKARVGVTGSHSREVRLAGNETAKVRLPVDLTKPGPATLRLTWGEAGRPAEAVNLPIDVPEPATVSGCPAFVSDGETADVVVTTRAEDCRVVATLSSEGGEAKTSFAAKRGRAARLKLTVAGQAKLTVGLVDAAGGWVGKPTVQRMIALR